MERNEPIAWAQRVVNFRKSVGREPTLEERILLALLHDMTPTEKRAQRQSFVHGQTKMTITLRSVGSWVYRLVGSKILSLVVMIIFTEIIGRAGGDDRGALVIGGIVWGYLLCRWRVL